MSQSDIIKDTSKRMDSAVEACKRELSTMRTGRATPSIFENIRVSCYGSQMPLQQLSTVSAPEPRLIVIQPWDKGTLKDIEKAIQASDLGLSPSNDGNVLRINIPALTEERRKELARMVNKVGEDAKISVRNVRQDANTKLKKMEKDGDITQDDLKKQTEDVQKLTDDHNKKIDALTEEKEQEILSF